MAAAHGRHARVHCLPHSVCTQDRQALRGLPSSCPSTTPLCTRTGRSRLMKPRDLPPQILQQMRDEVLQLMVWCIGTKKFSAEQIAEASDMISTHARMGSSSTGILYFHVPQAHSAFCVSSRAIHASVLSPDLHQPVEHFVGVLKGKIGGRSMRPTSMTLPCSRPAHGSASLSPACRSSAGAQPDAPSEGVHSQVAQLCQDSCSG
jgi:hypothetical protein